MFSKMAGSGVDGDSSFMGGLRKKMVLYATWCLGETGWEQISWKKYRNKLGLSCAKLRTSSVKLF